MRRFWFDRTGGTERVTFSGTLTSVPVYENVKWILLELHGPEGGTSAVGIDTGRGAKISGIALHLDWGAPIDGGADELGAFWYSYYKVCVSY